MPSVFVYLLSGILAGMGTGFAGLSAAVFIAPMLIAFLQVDSFTAVGVALASDVLASAVSALTYAHNGNIALRRGGVLMASVLVFTVVGTVIAHFVTGFAVGEDIVSHWLIIATLALGLNLLLFAREDKHYRDWYPILPPCLLGILSGLGIGFVCGFQGTGGGLWMLFVLNILLGFEFKPAVGTSVCIMTFTALIGAVSHFMIQGMPEPEMLGICILSTLISAKIAAVIANRISPRVLKRITGFLVTGSGLIMILVKIF